MLITLVHKAFNLPGQHHLSMVVSDIYSALGEVVTTGENKELDVLWI